ncbi:unnamed protein product, partial [Hymenolepis diminuta]
VSYLILADNIHGGQKSLLKLVATVTIFDSLRQAFTSHEIPKVIEPRNFAQFSSIQFEAFYCGLNVTLLHSPFNLICLDEVLVGNAKGSFWCHRSRRYICQISY